MVKIRRSVAADVQLISMKFNQPRNQQPFQNQPVKQPLFLHVGQKRRHGHTRPSGHGLWAHRHQTTSAMIQIRAIVSHPDFDVNQSRNLKR